MTGEATVTPCPTPEVRPIPVEFLPSVRLTKGEAFAACQALADAEPFLRHVGRHDEARVLGDLFDLLEERLTSRPVWTEVQSRSSTNSSESEFTQ